MISKIVKIIFIYEVTLDNRPRVESIFETIYSTSSFVYVIIVLIYKL